MGIELPVADDTLVWDAWLDVYKLPALSVALELEIFEALHTRADSAHGLAQRMDFDERGLNALLPMLVQLGFLSLHAGLYQLTQAGRHYMLQESPFYWGGLFSRIGKTIAPHRLLLETINKERARAEKSRPADGWESGHVDIEMGREVTAFMHCHSMPAALGMTKTYDFTGLNKVLDIGGGSGCFAISLALQDATRSCTVMELPTICTITQEYIAKAGVTQQVDTVSVDMFREAWPSGYDAHFFSNVFHDWSPETCQELAQSSFNALKPGGKILLHEMLLDDSQQSPSHAVTFSLLMAMGTMGQQFSLPQLQDMLSRAGFINVNCQHTYGYYSIVSAEKPQ